MAKPHYPALLFPHRWGEGGWLCLGGPLPTIVWLSVHLWLVQYYRLQWRVPRANKSCHFPFGESDALKRRKTSETRDSGPRITGKFPCSHLVAGSAVRRSFIFFATSSLKPAFYIDNFLASGWGCLKKRGGIFQTVPDGNSIAVIDFLHLSYLPGTARNQSVLNVWLHEGVTKSSLVPL